MALPFLDPVSAIMAGYGSASCNGSATQTITTTAGPTTLTIAAATTTPSTGGTPFNLNGGPPPSGGKVRIRTNTVNANTTTAITITATDGTTTLQIGQIGATAAGAAIDYTTDFRTDLAITSVSIAVTLGGSTFTASVDWEVSLTP
jgi:hypothetical protein